MINFADSRNRPYAPQYPIEPQQEEGKTHDPKRSPRRSAGWIIFIVLILVVGVLTIIGITYGSKATELYRITQLIEASPGTYLAKRNSNNLLRRDSTRHHAV